MQLVVGRIVRPHGVRGEVVVDVRTDSPDERYAAGTVFETEPAAAGPLTVSEFRPHQGRLLITFEGIADRGIAETLRGAMSSNPYLRVFVGNGYFDLATPFAATARRRATRLVTTATRTPATAARTARWTLASAARARSRARALPCAETARRRPTG